jgi:tetrahydromethanopterin S-methyltransferase subunit G
METMAVPTTDQRLDDLRADTVARIDMVETRFDTVDARFDTVDARFDEVDDRFDKVDARFDKVDAKFDRIDARFDAMQRQMTRFFAGIVGTVIAGVLLNALTSHL